MNAIKAHYHHPESRPKALKNKTDENEFSPFDNLGSSDYSVLTIRTNVSSANARHALRVNQTFEDNSPELRRQSGRALNAPLVTDPLPPP
jgi:hypothetical protein